jgi:hypothetical protein
MIDLLDSMGQTVDDLIETVKLISQWILGR